VQHFDAAQLQKLAEKHALQIAVTARPGAYVSGLRPLMLVEGTVDKDVASDLASAFVVGDQRSFESDPRFGLVVLAQIADRALSPAVNDPGTAIDVLGTLARLLANLPPEVADGEPANNRISVTPFKPQDLLEDWFRPIARDCAGTIEVVLHVLNSLEVIASTNPAFREAALAAARDAIGRAREALVAPTDVDNLEVAAAFASLSR